MLTNLSFCSMAKYLIEKLLNMHCARYLHIETDVLNNYRGNFSINCSRRFCFSLLLDGMEMTYKLMKTHMDSYSYDKLRNSTVKQPLKLPTSSKTAKNC